MARKVNTAIMWRGRPLGSGDYPWEEWLNGQVWQIGPDDARCDLESLRRMVYKAAKRRRGRARTRFVDGLLYVQFHG